MAAEKTDTPTLVQVAQKVHRPRHLIEADLAAARERFGVLHKLNGSHEEARQKAIERRDRLRARWEKENPGEPFEPAMFNPPVTVPDRDTPSSREFHAIHYRVANLERELIESKAAETGAY